MTISIKDCVPCSFIQYIGRCGGGAPGVGEAAGGRLEPDDAAERRRHAHGPWNRAQNGTSGQLNERKSSSTRGFITASVGAEGDGAEPGADGGGGPARGAAGDPADVVGVARGAVVRVDAAGSRAELVHVGLAGHDGAARAQLRHARRVRRAPPRRPQPPRAACTHASSLQCIIAARRSGENLHRR